MRGQEGAEYWVLGAGDEAGGRLRLTAVVIWLMALAWAGGLAWAQPPGACAEAGRVERITYRSAIADTTMWASVYLPGCYRGRGSRVEDQAGSGALTPQPAFPHGEGERYPIVYLMHGSNEDDGQWLRLGLAEWLDAAIREGRAPAMIVVMPFGEWIANENRFDAWSWERVFVDELMPLVETQYAIDGTAAARAIGGISRGGFWAYSIGLRRPDLFSAIGGHSAFFDRYHAPEAHNPLDLALMAPGVEGMRLWLDRGADDFAADGLELMAERLRERGLPFTYVVHPTGQHTGAYWQAHLGEYLAFYSEALGAGQERTGQVPSLEGAGPSGFAFVTNTPPAMNAPAASATPTAAGEGWQVFLPVVAFNSLQHELTSETLAAVRRGEPVSGLVVDAATAAALAGLGVTVDPGAVVADGTLENRLRRDGRLFTLLSFQRLRPDWRVLHIAGEHPLASDLATYPLAWRGGEAAFEPGKLSWALFSGVTALTRLTTEALDTNGVAWAAEALAPFTMRADVFHVSNEVSFVPDCPRQPPPFPSAFCSKEAHFGVLERLGVDIVELTGNHNLDYGPEPYLETLDWYAARGMRTVGGGVDLQAARLPLLLDLPGGRLGVLACNAAGPGYALAQDDAPGAASCDWNWLREAIPALRAQADVVVVLVQYVEVEDYIPLPQQVSDFRGMADLGADVVLGSQAHKAQDFEFYASASGRPAVLHYGLGNLYFDQPFWGNVRFFMDNLLLYEGRLVGIDVFSGIIEGNGRPREMTADERLNFWAFMMQS